MEDKTLNKLKRMKKAELIEEVVRLADENESLWAMHDEMKASDMANYKPQFQKMVNRKVKELKHMMIKPIQAFSMGKKNK
tara:strand:- start:715 stop:954 length:240 start_codon:yes stop_codon:yes gene_type:complete